MARLAVRTPGREPLATPHEEIVVRRHHEEAGEARSGTTLQRPGSEALPGRGLGFTEPHRRIREAVE